MSKLVPLDMIGEINEMARDLTRLRMFIAVYDPAWGCSANAVVNLSVGSGEGAYKLPIDDPIPLLRDRESALEEALRQRGVDPGPKAEARPNRIEEVAVWVKTDE